MESKILYSNATHERCRYNPYSAAKLGLTIILATDYIAHMPYCVVSKMDIERIPQEIDDHRMIFGKDITEVDMNQ